VVLAIVLFSIPFCVPCEPPGANSSCATLRRCSWVLSGGIVGGLLFVVRFQRSSQQLVEYVKRGLVFDPFLGAVVALFIYLAFLTGLVSFNLSITTDVPEFVWPFLLGGGVGFSWDVVVGRFKNKFEP
jgi:hypothetical protein